MSGVPSLNIYSPGTGVYPSSWANGVVQGGALYSDLRQFSGVSNMSVYMVGTVAPGDGGQGLFVWNSTVTGTDDGGVTTIVPFGTSFGAWLRDDPVPPQQGIIPTAAMFGVVGDGVTDDTAAWIAAIAGLRPGSPLLAIGKSGNAFKITGPLTISTNGLGIFGGANSQANFTASGNFSAVFVFSSTAANVMMENVGIITTGTTTQCVALNVGSQAIGFFNVAFTGNLTGNLIYSQCAGFLTCRDCVWQCNATATVGITLDAFNQNTLISGGRAGGVGEFLDVVNTTGNPANGVQGLTLEGVHTVCTAPVSISIGGQLFQAIITGCTIDQAGTNCIVVGDGAAFVTITSSWIGLRDNSMGQCVLILAGAGQGQTIEENTFFGGSSNVYVQSSVSARNAAVLIEGNTFQAASGSALALDAVNGCVIQGNQDTGPSPQGSWATLATNTSGGAYTFGSNNWVSAAIANSHSASSYYASGYDRGAGALLKASGVITSPSGTQVTFAHGLVLTPDIIQITQSGGSGMTYNATASGANITIFYGSSGAASFFWTAEVHH